MVTIGTWNLENLFRPGDDAGPGSAGEYDAKLSALAATIETADVDVLALQEVGRDVLDDLAGRLDGDWNTALSQFPDGRGIRVGYLARHELTDPVDVVDLPAPLAGGRVDDDGTVATRMGRGALQVSVTAGGRDLTLVTCHFKSKLLSYPGGRFAPTDEDQRARYGVYALNRRAAEAATIRYHANTLLDGDGVDRAVIVLGDLNDTVDAATTQLLLGPGGSEIGTPGERRPDQGDGWRLWNLAPRIPEEVRYSRVYRGRRELIDHVLISRALLEHVAEATTVTPGPLPSITDDPRERTGEPASDHALVLARLTPV